MSDQISFLDLSYSLKEDNPFEITHEFIGKDTNFSEPLVLDMNLVKRVKQERKFVFVNSHFKKTLQNCLTFISNHGDLPTGSTIQKKMEKGVRKRLAANFTNHATFRFIGDLAKEFEPQIRSVADPFAGSGRLLMGIQSSFANKLDLFASEIFPESAVATLQTMLELILLGKAKTATVFLADAFDLENLDTRFDMIVMNPPFTRRHRFKASYLQKIEGRLNTYLPYISGQPGLHLYSIFLADKMLKEKGILIAILPAATFSSDYSQGLMSFLLENYSLHALYSMNDKSSFSDGSKIREIILMASKTPRENGKIRFITLRKTSDGVLEPVGQPNIISQSALKGDWNWLKHFYNSLTRLDFLTKIHLFSISQLDISLIRGLEMYGPEFFIMPNEEWILETEENSNLCFRSLLNKNSIKIPKQFLVPVFRKPSYYKQQITPEVEHWIISIPPDKQLPWLKKYVEDNSHKAKAAIRTFGENWIHHVHRQITAKQPFGYLFIVDKFGFNSVGTFIHFVDTKVSATKNFYILKADYRVSKIVAAWLSSSLFLTIYLRSRRVIGRDLGRLQISDYKREPLFIDPKSIDEPYLSHIIDAFDEIRHQLLQPLPDQIKEEKRKKLDLAWINFLNNKYGLSINLDSIYSALNE